MVVDVVVCSNTAVHTSVLVTAHKNTHTSNDLTQDCPDTWKDHNFNKKL